MTKTIRPRAWATDKAFVSFLGQWQHLRNRFGWSLGKRWIPNKHLYYEYVLNIHILLLFLKEHINLFSNNFQVEKSNSVRRYSLGFMTLLVIASNASSYEFCTHRSKHLCKSLLHQRGSKATTLLFPHQKETPSVTQRHPPSLRRGWPLFLWSRRRRDKSPFQDEGDK